MEINYSLTNDINLDNNLENKQNKFLESNLGKVINTGVDMGIRYLLPDLIEDQVIDVKDAIINRGFKEGVKTAINSAVNMGKSIKGIFTGKFDNIDQVESVIKSGGIIDSVSNVLDYAIDKTTKSGKIDGNVSAVLRSGKNAILNSVSNNIENEFEREKKSLKLLEKYNNNWKNYFNEQDFDGMEKEYKKIKEKIKDIIPLENTIKQTRNIENLHLLIKKNGRDFNLSEEELKLAEIL